MENVVETPVATTTKKVTKKPVIAKTTAVVTNDLRDLKGVTVEEATDGQNTKLSQAAFLTLCMLNYDQKPNLTEADEDFLDGTMIKITDPVRDELIRKGVAELNGDKLVITKFGTKWALQSQSFGQNFDQLVKNLNFGAKIKLLFNLVDNINESLQDKIRIIGKDGTPSKLWEGLNGIVTKMANWLEVK